MIGIIWLATWFAIMVAVMALVFQSRDWDYLVSDLACSKPLNDVFLLFQSRDWDYLVSDLGREYFAGDNISSFSPVIGIIWLATFKWKHFQGEVICFSPVIGIIWLATLVAAVVRLRPLHVSVP